MTDEDLRPSAPERPTRRAGITLNVVLLLWRTRLRSSWRSAVILAVVIGLGGAVTLAVAAGARRTASANEAILGEANASDVVTSVTPGDPDVATAALRSLPDVAEVDLWIGFVGGVRGVDPASITSILGFWSDRPAVDRPFITSGRFPTGPRDALVNEVAAARSGLRVGSRLQVSLADATFSDFETIEVDIVGIGLFPDGVIEDELTSKNAVWLSRSLTEQHLDRQFYGSGRLVLSRGDVAGVTAGLKVLRSTGPSDSSGADLVIGEVRDEDRARVQKALRPLLLALAGLAGLAGGATVLVSAQALGRTIRRRRVDDRSLATMGCTTGQLVAADLAFTASLTVPGILLAVAGAVAASPLFPVGPTRRFGAIGGADIDPIALGGGSLMLGTLILLAVGAGSWRRRARPGTLTPGRAPGLLGARPASATGLRLLTGRRGVASMAVGVSAGLAAMVAALTFTGSLDHLVADPELVGMGWDVIGREGYTKVDLAAVGAAVEGDASVTRVSGLGYLDGELNGVTTPVAEVHSIQGDPWPPIIAGRAPRSPSEILIGKATLRTLRLRMGDQVKVSLAGSFGDKPRREERGFTIVGSAVIPAIGLAGIYTPRLDLGALLPPGSYEAMVGEPPRTDVVLFDLAATASASSLRNRFPDGLPDKTDSPTEWFTSAQPAEVSQAEEARTVIWLAVAALAIAVVAAIAHTLLGFVRQRRRDYAVLKALGFTGRQIRSTVLWQSGAILAVALMAALPIGAAAGRWLWTAFAGRIGVIVEPVTPLLLLAACALLSCLVVQGTALIPASLARRTSPAQALHGE